MLREREEQIREIQNQADALQRHEQRIEQLLETIELLRRKRFGASADRVPDEQLKLFDEAELEALIAELEAERRQVPARALLTSPNPIAFACSTVHLPGRTPAP